ncbi:MAG: hypothetical protein ACI9GK_001940 [Devosia sp.]|jgi:hypothetical protein
MNSDRPFFSAIAEFGGHIDIDRQPRIAFEPVFGHSAGQKGRAAGADGQAAEIGEVERHLLADRDLFGAHVHIMAERMTDGFGLLVDFLGHEVAVITLVDHQRRGLRDLHIAFDNGVLGVANGRAGMGDHGPVAIFEIAQAGGERGQCHGVGAQIHLAIAIADGQRRAVSGRDQQPLIVAEHEGQSEGAAQLFERIGHGLFGLSAPGQFARHPERHGFGIGLGGGLIAILGQIDQHVAVVFDNAVMHHTNAIGGVWVGIELSGGTMGGPAGMANADRARQWFGRQFLGQIAQLALGAAAGDIAISQRGDAGAVIAAIFQALERIHEAFGNRLIANNTNDTAHG